MTRGKVVAYIDKRATEPIPRFFMYLCLGMRPLKWSIHVLRYVGVYLYCWDLNGKGRCLP